MGSPLSTSNKVDLFVTILTSDTRASRKWSGFMGDRSADIPMSCTNARKGDAQGYQRVAKED